MLYTNTINTHTAYLEKRCPGKVESYYPVRSASVLLRKPVRSVAQFAFDYIICVVGDQGAGKSTFFRLLAVEDEWFTDDLKDLESNRVYEKLQGHWIIELSEMLATNNAKSNEAIKSFLSRQKEIYRTPYERYPKDRPRQCVFAGTTNKISFLPSDRTGNRRFLSILCREGEAEVFILDNEAESREHIRQMWAEVMEI